MGERVRPDLHPAGGDGAQPLVVEEPEARGPLVMVPVVGAADMAGDGEDERRETALGEQWAGDVKQIRVPVVEAEQEGAGRRLAASLEGAQQQIDVDKGPARRAQSIELCDEPGGRNGVLGEDRVIAQVRDGVVGENAQPPSSPSEPSHRMSTPLFSIVVTTYNRARIVRRCIDSCLAQTEKDFELVVVDDGSTDDTVDALRREPDSRLQIVSHEGNRGINPARHTGVAASSGDWVVVVDSDDELLPTALARLREAISEQPPEVGAIRFRLRHDDGRITPSFVPEGPYGYVGRIRWAEREGGHDAGRCLRRSVLAASPYIRGRRGAMETLFELNLARETASVCLADVLGEVHSDAPNSWLRAASGKELLPRLVREAPDMLWMAETTLGRHGAALREHGPRQYRLLLRVAAAQAFLLGRRRAGVGYARAALRLGPADTLAWATLVLGTLGPAALARGTLAHRLLSR